MSGDALREQDLALRLHIYRFWCQQARPPTLKESAAAGGSTAAEAHAAWQRLHAAHLILLDVDGQRLRMANPLSAVETDFRVQVGDRWLYANCAWDAPGIPAMLGQDADIEARFSPGGEMAHFRIRDGQLQAQECLVHFALPFRRWYDDLVET